MTPTQFANKVSDLIINPILALIFAAALLVFFWGMIQYLYALNQGGKDSPEGKRHMIWGVVGMFIMTAAWGIFKIIQSTVNSIGH